MNLSKIIGFLLLLPFLILFLCVFLPFLLLYALFTALSGRPVPVAFFRAGGNPFRRGRAGSGERARGEEEDVIDVEVIHSETAGGEKDHDSADVRKLGK